MSRDVRQGQLLSVGLMASARWLFAAAILVCAVDGHTPGQKHLGIMPDGAVEKAK